MVMTERFTLLQGYGITAVRDISTHMHAHMRTYMHTHAHMHTCVHTHTHTRTQA